MYEPTVHFGGFNHDDGTSPGAASQSAIERVWRDRWRKLVTRGSWGWNPGEGQARAYERLEWIAMSYWNKFPLTRAEIAEALAEYGVHPNAIDGYLLSEHSAHEGLGMLGPDAPWDGNLAGVKPRLPDRSTFKGAPNVGPYERLLTWFQIRDGHAPEGQAGVAEMEAAGFNPVHAQRFLSHPKVKEILGAPSVVRSDGRNWPIDAAGIPQKATADRTAFDLDEGILDSFFDAVPASESSVTGGPEAGASTATPAEGSSDIRMRRPAAEPEVSIDPALAARRRALARSGAGGAKRAEATICGAYDCDRAIGWKDFRCFSCGDRFCQMHRGTRLDCPTCESRRT